MKTKLILTLAAMLFIATGMQAVTPYAVFCSDNSLHFLCSDTKPTEGGTLASNKKSITKVFEVDLNQRISSPPSWNNYTEKKMSQR